MPEDHPDIATSLNNIGLTLDNLGRHEEALEKKKAALEIWQRVLPEDHPDIATSLNNIGYTLDSLGQYEEALEEGLMTDEDVLSFIISQGMWSEKMEDEYQRIAPKHIEYFKKEF